MCTYFFWPIIFIFIKAFHQQAKTDAHLKKKDNRISIPHPPAFRMSLSNKKTKVCVNKYARKCHIRAILALCSQFRRPPYAIASLQVLRLLCPEAANINSWKRINDLPFQALEPNLLDVFAFEHDQWWSPPWQDPEAQVFPLLVYSQTISTYP